MGLLPSNGFTSINAKYLASTNSCNPIMEKKKEEGKQKISNLVFGRKTEWNTCKYYPAG
jgi:hypothetical protein